MNWYGGDIEQAILESRQKNAIFVVYVAGKDSNTDRMTEIINEEKIRKQLESENFVAIRIESDSQSYIQFARIYQVVPVPSIFFIGKSGVPIEIGTSVVQSADELDDKIKKVLNSQAAPNSASSSFIAAEKNASAASDDKSAKQQEQMTEQKTDTQIGGEQNSVTTTTAAAAAAAESSTSANVRPKESDIVCENGVCYKRSPSKENSPIEVPQTTEKRENAGSSEVGVDLAATREILEQQRRARIEEEKKEEKERELRRRREGKEVMHVQEWQREQELKDLKSNIRRERLEEQAARERIRAQIAADRAERAEKFSIPTADANKEQAAKADQNASAKPDHVRLQFRLLNGETHMNAFKPDSTILELREYVSHKLLDGAGVNDFMLCTAYPRYEFTVEDNASTLVDMGLFPSAVILVITKASYNPTSIIERSGGIINIMSTLFWTMLAPVFSIFNYLRNAVTNRNAGTADGTQKRANEDTTTNSDAAKRRNLDGFMSAGPSTSKESEKMKNFEKANDQKPYRRYGASNVHHLTDMQKDSDDENATWNGNSTQQQ